MVELRGAELFEHERGERFFVRRIFFERGFEVTEAARLVAETSERDVGLREPQEATLARVFGLRADRAERLDDLRPAMDVFVELPQGAEDVDVVGAEVS